jgi:hypothetical protein
MQTNVEFQAKADELIVMAKELGLDAKITWISGLSYMVTYNQNLWSTISYTNTRKVSVQSFERAYRKNNKVSFKNLPEYIAFYASKVK